MKKLFLIAAVSVISVLVVSDSAFAAGSYSFDKTDYCVGDSYSWSITSNPSGATAYLHRVKNGATQYTDLNLGNTPLSGSGTWGSSEAGNTYDDTIHFEKDGNHTWDTRSLTVRINNCVPTATISANPTSVTYEGSSTITWSSTYSTSCSVTKNGAAWASGASGSQGSGPLTINPTTFAISCSGNYGNSSNSVNVSVGPPPVFCSPSSQTINAGFEKANFSASGGDGSYLWSAPGAEFVSGGTGSTFWAQYPNDISPGPKTKTVTVSSTGGNSNCSVSVVPNAYITSMSPSIEWWLPVKSLPGFVGFGQDATVNLNGNSERLSNDTARYEAKPFIGGGGTSVCSRPGIYGPNGSWSHWYDGDLYKFSCGNSPNYNANFQGCVQSCGTSVNSDIGTEEAVYQPFLGLWELYDRKINSPVTNFNSSFSATTNFAYPTGATAVLKSVSGNQITATISGSNNNPAGGDSSRLYLDYYYRFIDNGSVGVWSAPIATNSKAVSPNKFNVDQTFTCQNGRKVEFQVKNRYNHNLHTSRDFSMTSQIDLSCTGINYPPNVTVDVKIDGSNGPLSVPNGYVGNLSWTATGGSGIACNASAGNWSGNKAANGSESTGTLTGSATYSYVLSCTNTEGGNGSDSVTINVSGPTLDATLSTSPSSGLEPLTTSLTANVSGTAIGTTTYKFDCTNDGTYDGTYTNNSNDQSHFCTYYWSSQNNGVYTAKVRVERQGAFVEKTTTVTANQQTLSATLTANPTSGNSPLQVNFTATVSGTAVGTINYTFWKNCSYAGTSVSEGISRCGNPDKKIDNSSNTSESWNVTYPQIGTNEAKLIVERGVASSAQNSQTINVINNKNNKPAVSNVKVTEPNYCFSGPAATVEWTFSDPEGDPQSAYQVQIDDQGSFNSPEHDTGKVSCADCRSNNTGPGKLAFNKTYEARVKAWDSNNLESDWTKMSILCDSAGTCKSAGSWKTPKHTYPTTAVDLFTWTPAEPAANEEVQFTDKTKCFNDSNSQIACDSWNWTFGDGNSSTLQNPKYTYLNIGSYTVTEVVKDKDNLSCQASKVLNITEKVPIFKEVSPKK